MDLVMIESPYAGDTETHIKYLKRAMLDSAGRGEAPFASHLIYTQILDDNIPGERELGMRMGVAWAFFADKIAVYTDYGISEGMETMIDLARDEWAMEVVFRQIGRNP